MVTYRHLVTLRYLKFGAGILALTVILVDLLLFSKIFLYPGTFDNLFSKEYVPPYLNNGQTKVKTILFWNEYIGSREFFFGVGSEPFQRAKCPVDACYAHWDRAVLNPERVDAILIHGRSQSLYLSSGDRFRPDLSYKRNPETQYIYFIHESPAHQYQDLTEFDGFYNATMTYRRDSDIPVPFGQFVERKEKFSVAHENFARGKKKFAAWFVSNCRDKSARQVVAENLQQYIDVDIYGYCGPLSCNKELWECFDMLNDYKFYFSFENSLCKDYVTEKMFSVMNYTVIPVVWSGADVHAITPPHSVINVADFESPKRLAHYLIYLARNDTAFNEYFQWRGQFEQRLNRSFDNWKVNDWHFDEGFCDLCAWMHRQTPPNQGGHNTIMHKSVDIDAWYRKDACVGVDHPAYRNFTQPVSRRTHWKLPPPQLSVDQ